MAASDRPELPLTTRHEIERDIHEIDKKHWRQLAEMLVPLGGFGRDFRGSQLRRPEHLSWIVSTYAQALFYAESSKYPKPNPQLPHWLKKLAARTREYVFERVDEVERSERYQSLSFHGLQPSQLRKVVDEALQEAIDKWPLELRPPVSPERSDISTPYSYAVQKTELPKPKRMAATVTSPRAARKMEDYLERKGIGLTDFAAKAQTTDRTLRNFRKTGKVRRDILNGIAKAMGVTKEELLND